MARSITKPAAPTSVQAVHHTGESRVSIPTAELGGLAANREQMIVELRARLSAFENRHEAASARLRAALGQGTIRETAEVAEWLIAWDTYGALLDERQARAG